MTIPLRQSTASQEIPLGFFVDSTDGNTEQTGLTIANTDILLWKNGATSLAAKNSGGATHMSNGVYYAVLDATDTDTLGALHVYVHVAGALTVKTECCVYPANVYDSLIAGSDLLDANAAQINGAAAPTLTGDAYARIGANGAGLTALGDTRLANLDAAMTSRAPASTALSNADYTSARASKLDNLDASVSTRLPTSSYTAPDNAGIASLGSGQTTIIGNQTTINSNVLTRLPTSSYTAPDNADIAAIKAKTDNLPASPAATSDIPSATTIASAVWSTVIEGSYTAVQLMRLFASSLFGKLSGVSSGAPKFRDLADTKNRISAATTSDGRTSVTLDGS